MDISVPIPGPNLLSILPLNGYVYFKMVPTLNGLNSIDLPLVASPTSSPFSLSSHIVVNLVQYVPFVADPWWSIFYCLYFLWSSH